MTEYTPKNVVERENQLLKRLFALISNKILGLQKHFAAKPKTPELFPEQVVEKRLGWKHQPIAPAWKHPYLGMLEKSIEEAISDEAQRQRRMMERDLQAEKAALEEEHLRGQTTFQLDITEALQKARGVFDKGTNNRLSAESGRGKPSRRYYPETRYKSRERVIKIRDIQPYDTLLDNKQRYEDTGNNQFSVLNETPPPIELAPIGLMFDMMWLPEQVTIDKEHVESFRAEMKRKKLLRNVNRLNALLEKRIREIEKYPINEKGALKPGGSIRA